MLGSDDLRDLLPIMRRMIREERASARAAVDQSIFRPGVVATAALPGAAASVRLDGDLAAVTVVNVSNESVNAGQRVTVLLDPPHGAFIVGALTTDQWIDFSPTVTQSVTITYTRTYCRYKKVGRKVTYQGYLDITSAGTGGNNIEVLLPVASVVPGGIGRTIGVAEYYHPGTGAIFFGNAFIPATTYFRARHYSGTSAGVYGGNNIGTGTANFALASGDVINWAVEYEAAS